MIMGSILEFLYFRRESPRWMNPNVIPNVMPRIKSTNAVSGLLELMKIRMSLDLIVYLRRNTVPMNGMEIRTIPTNFLMVVSIRNPR